jgi:hypothetical protein
MSLKFKMFFFPSSVVCRSTFQANALHLLHDMPPFIPMAMKTVAVVKSHFWPKITSATSRKELKTKTAPLTFNCYTYSCTDADNFYCFSPRPETYYTNFPANCLIPSCRWFVSLSRVQNKNLSYTDETFPNLFSKHCLLNLKDVFGRLSPGY